MNNIKKLISQLIWFITRIFHRIGNKNILFIPHVNSRYDGYDMLNGGSDNVLCLFNSVLKDPNLLDYELYIVCYFPERFNAYKEYVKPYGSERIHFVLKKDFRTAFTKCKYIFTDDSFSSYYKSKVQKIICLNYFAGLIKNEFAKWEMTGGYKRMLREQKKMYNTYDYHLSCSEISSKFIALDNCLYYPRFLNLGFPRNDVFFDDNIELRKEIEKMVDFKVDKIITYVPTHRDYENKTGAFASSYNEDQIVKRTLWGVVENADFESLESVLEKTNTLIIAKIHPKQERSMISGGKSRHILYFGELRKHVDTSLNPVLAVSDYMITDYTTAVYDFLYTGRPIIYYFYDYELYNNARGFFINPIQSICAGHIAYNMKELIAAIIELTSGKDPFKKRREIMQELFIKYPDGNSTKRIKDFFFKN